MKQDCARRAHTMPFGAEVKPGEPVRFRLWAPAARRVDLEVIDGPTIEMSVAGGGWYEVRTSAATAGDRYRYRIDERVSVPDPASRFQPDGVHGPSQVIDPSVYAWRDVAWLGRPWHETVLYELHVGTFTTDGTFDAVSSKLDDLVDLGVSAIQLMPVASFAGQRGWGYDGVLPYAPHPVYGRPGALKSLVDRAHAAGLMVFLDVVYNHLGPEGNYLHQYAPAFFTDRHTTPWGDAIDFEGAAGSPVREYFIHNALYWLEEFHVDGLRLDAVDHMHDRSITHVLRELLTRVRAAVGSDRHVHLVIEDPWSDTTPLRVDEHGHSYDALWNDDFHHASHVLATQQKSGCFIDFCPAPVSHLARCLGEGLSYQGGASRYHHGRRRGRPTTGLEPTAFVTYLQNHDQVANRPRSARLGRLAPAAAVRALTAVQLLAPAPPLIFMGQEWNAPEPFPFFCDFDGELADNVAAGRRRAVLGEWSELANQMPDPSDAATFESAILDRAHRGTSGGRSWISLVRRLLSIRREAIIPRLRVKLEAAQATHGAEHLLECAWNWVDGAKLTLVANLGPSGDAPVTRPDGRLLFVLSGAEEAPTKTLAPDTAQDISDEMSERPALERPPQLAAKQPALERAPRLAAERPTLETPPWFVAWFLRDAS